MASKGTETSSKFHLGGHDGSISTHLDKTWDVVVAGAGPVGLFTACELAMKGVSVLVLEQTKEEEASVWRQQVLGQRNLFIPAIEAFYRRGLLEKIFPNHEQRPQQVPQKKAGFQMAGHFAGIMINGSNVDYSRWDGIHLPGPACVPDTCIIGHVENVLAERAESLGVRIVRGKGVTDVVDLGDNVQVFSGDDCINAQWLVGCDGGRSTVRKAAGIDFEGTEAEFTGYAVQCTLDQPQLLKPGFCRTPNGLYIMHGPLVWALEHGTTFDRSAEISREHFEQVLQRVSGTRVRVLAVHHALSFSDRCKQAAQYRKGRVLLAGDSAHIHPPFGAQGLNTGIADAMNLGWKLAATVKGFDAPGLIDTYHNERQPEAAAVLDWVRAQIVTMRPGQLAAAAASLIRDFNNTTDGATHSVGYVWGLSQRYRIGDEHVLIGRSAPDVELEQGERLGPYLRRGSFVLVDFEGNDTVAQYVRSLQPLVRYARSFAKGQLDCKALLVRSDGIVTWAPTLEVSIDSLRNAISRWIRAKPTTAPLEDIDIPSSTQGWSGVPVPVSVDAVIGRSLDSERAYQVLGHDATNVASSDRSAVAA